MIEIVHIISFYSAEGKSLYDTNRDEYIVDLTVDMIDSIKKETDIEKINIDDDALFDYFFTN